MATAAATTGGMRRPSSAIFSLQSQVLAARRQFGGQMPVYILLFLLAIFALTAFHTVPSSVAGGVAAPPRQGTSLRGTATAMHAAAAKAAAAEAQAAAAGGDGPAPGACHAEAGAEYSGEDVITWGTNNLQDTAAACCASCQAAAAKGCSVWVWCGEPGGCEGGRAHKECWLKRQRNMTLHAIAGRRGTKFTSGALYDEAARKASVAGERARLAALKADKDLPLVWIDVAIKGKPVGRIHFVLFVKEAPRAAENFRQLITGEKGTVPEGHEGAGKPYHLKGKPFYRIIDAFIDQSGAETDSVFGGPFKDDPGGLKLVHNRKGLLSMANTGPDSNTSHFSIMVAPAPHLNGHYTIFGEAVDGFEVIDAINALSRGKKDNTATAEAGAVIADCGQLRRGEHVPKLDQM